MVPAPSPVRVAVVGAGHVGSTFAYALLLSGLASEIVLIDADRRRAEGEALDLSHAIPFARASHVFAGTLEDCAGASVVVVTAGAAQRPGETRLDLVRRNVATLRSLLPDLARHAPAAVLLVATNPVDVLTWVAATTSGLPARRVLGSGTVLDTARFRALLGDHFDVDPRSVHASVIGEHGDSEVPVWSLANVGGMPLSAWAASNGVPFDAAVRERIGRETREAAYRVIERKGSTAYAIGAGLLRITEAVLGDQGTVLCVSTRVRGILGLPDVCLGLPCVVGREGVEAVLPLELAPDELEALHRSARLLRASIDALDDEGPGGRGGIVRGRPDTGTNEEEVSR